MRNRPTHSPIMKLREPDVTLTDFGLAIECAWFALVLLQTGYSTQPANDWFVAFFAATGLAALLGAVTHGFVTDQKSALYRTLWIGIFALIGLAALASWNIGSRLILGDEMAKIVSIGAVIALAVYMTIILAVSQSYTVAIIHYLPAAIFLLVAFATAYFRSGAINFALGAGGVILTFAAALVQIRRVRLHAVYFDHNAFYHLIQAVALFLIFLSAKG